MSPRVKVAYAGPDWTPLPAHPAPNANAHAVGQSNVSVVALVAGVGQQFQSSGETTLVMIHVTSATRFLVGGSGDLSASGFPLEPGYHSFSVSPGTLFGFWSAAACTVTILEN